MGSISAKPIVAQGTAWAGGVLAALGGLVIIAAVVGPSMGFGAGEGFVSYIWFGLTRRAFFWLGILIAVAGASALAVVLWWQVLCRNALVWSLNGLLVIASCMFGLLALEVAIRLVDGVPVFLLRNWLAERNALLKTQSANAYDPFVGWVLRPHMRVDANDPNSSFTTGEYGIRLNAPDAGPPPRGAILVTGDSFTAGSEVGDRHTWPANLERLLGRPVINAATGGWASDQIVLRAESLIPLFEPTHVVVSFFDDDVLRAGFRVYGGANKPWFAVKDGRLVHHNNPVPPYRGKPAETPAVLLIPSHSYLLLWLADRLGLSNWWQALTVSHVRADNDPIEVSCKLLERLKRATEGRGMDLLFVMQYPGHVRHSADRPKPHASRVVACARRAGIETVDLWDDLAAVHRRSLSEYVGLFATFDGRGIFSHMSSAGNRFVAERVAARINSMSARRANMTPPS